MAVTVDIEAVKRRLIVEREGILEERYGARLTI